MRSKLRIIYYFLLLTSFILLSCTPQAQSPTPTNFYIYRFDPPAFIKLSEDFQQLGEFPFSIPHDCSLLDVYPAPVGKYLLIELNCPNGQTVLFLDTDSGSVTQPITDTDSHFLAWTSDGKSAYLKVDSLGNAHIARVSPREDNDFIPVAAFTYDLSTNPVNRDFTFTFSRGMGQGSEIWLAKRDGKVVQQLYADKFSYISFARYSSDGKKIAFIKIPDSQTPFTVGELWIMNSDGSNPRKLADADAGHGYAANWSPDGTQIAFVKRENPEDESANQSSDSLISNIYLVNIQSGETSQITHFTGGRVETPHWSPDANTLAFNTVLNGRMAVQIVDIHSGQIRSLITELTCCAAWMRK
jgi:Tol biopolymer transport system component